VLHQLTPSFFTVNLLRAELAYDSHTVCSLKKVHFAGLVLFSVSLSSLHFSAKMELFRAKIAPASVAVGHRLTLEDFRERGMFSSIDAYGDSEGCGTLLV
jgi:hypothetical protein